MAIACGLPLVMLICIGMTSLAFKKLYAAPVKPSTSACTALSTVERPSLTIFELNCPRGNVKLEVHGDTIFVLNK